MEIIQVSKFTELVQKAVFPTLGSEASKRVYGQTYKKWEGWCNDNLIHPLNYSLDNVMAFLTSSNTTKATRQRELAAMKKLAKMVYIHTEDENAGRLYRILNEAKVPAPEDTSNERQKTALTSDQADKMLRAWDGDSDKEKRNRALIAVLLLSGVRRSEALALKWSDIDLENGVIHIRHGKGDKERDVPLAGDFGLDALRQWQDQQPDGLQYVFCSVKRGGGIGKHDKPISGQAVYMVVKATQDRVKERYGVDVDWKPHDARRTLITEALATGTPVHTVQAIAGHARGDTTLLYAKAVDARKAREALKLRYG